MLNFNFAQLLITIPAVLIALTVHEYCHGLAAYKLGDLTAKYSGRLSLNPLHHIDPLGFICLVFFRFGWAKPVPINTSNFKKPRRDMAITAAAGPVSNLLLAVLIILIIRTVLIFPVGDIAYALLSFLNTTAYISIGLAIFNLIPVPPLDGSKILLPLLPYKAAAWFSQYGYIIQIVIILLLFFNILLLPLTFLTSGLYNGISSGVDSIFSLLGV